MRHFCQWPKSKTNIYYTLNQYWFWAELVAQIEFGDWNIVLQESAVHLTEKLSTKRVQQIHQGLLCRYRNANMSRKQVIHVPVHSNRSLLSCVSNIQQQQPDSNIITKNFSCIHLLNMVSQLVSPSLPPRPQQEVSSARHRALNIFPVRQ